MKFRQTCIILGIMFLSATAFGQSVHLIVCRGGGNMNLEYKNSSMTIEFKKGTKLVDKNWNGISPGECSFRDRPIAASEPDKIKWKIDNFSIRWTGNVETISPEPINMLLNHRRYQSFNVKDDNLGSFKVISLGESRQK